MRQISQGATVRVAALLECRRRNEQGRRDAGRHQKDTHDNGRGGQQLSRVADRFLNVSRALDQRHDRDAGFKA